MKKLINLNYIYLLFWPLSLLYICIVFVRNLFYSLKILSIKNLPGKTISVGNIEVGGSGKTPLVRYIAHSLIKNGYRPAILIRGYRGGIKSKDFLVYKGDEVVEPFNVNYPVYPDEAVMLASELKSVPVIVGKNRYSNAMRYWSTDQNITHWILDDGFSHRSIFRHLDLLIITDKILSNFYRLPLPVGRLREPLIQANRADFICLRNGSDIFALSEFVKSNVVSKPTAYVSYHQTPPIQAEGDKTSIDDEEVFLCAGVADAKRVKKQLLEQGISVKKTLFVADHKKFNFAELRQQVNGYKAIITTKKDYFRQKQEFRDLGIAVFCVDLEVIVDKSDLFLDLLKI